MCVCVFGGNNLFEEVASKWRLVFAEASSRPCGDLLQSSLDVKTHSELEK